jgi:hypothetical protein
VKRDCGLFKTSVLAFILCSVTALAQEKSHIVVTGNELNSGVVILHIQKAEKNFHLQCNQGAAGCTTLTNGKYQMVELPENYGMYECNSVTMWECILRPWHCPTRACRGARRSLANTAWCRSDIDRSFSRTE